MSCVLCVCVLGRDRIMLITICIPVDLTRKGFSPRCPGSFRWDSRPPVESSLNCSHYLNTDLPSGCLVINIWYLYKLEFPWWFRQ